MKPSLKNEYCKPDLNLFSAAIAPPTSFSCILCDEQHVSLSAYNQHVQSKHLDHLGIAREGSEKPTGGKLTGEGASHVHTVALGVQTNSSSSCIHQSWPIARSSKKAA